MFLGKSILKICSKFTGEHPCRSAISIKLQSNLIEITLRHGCSPVNLLHIFRTPFYKNASGGLPLMLIVLIIVIMMKMMMIILVNIIIRSSQRRCSLKKVFLEISQNSRESTCSRVSFLIKLQAQHLF